MCAAAKYHITAGQIDQLRNSEACLQGKQQKSAITPAEPGRYIGRRDKRFDFRAVQIIDRSLSCRLDGIARDPLTMVQELSFIGRRHI